MRKQVQKERCTKIKLEKCQRVCCLYDKIQLAAARMLNADPSIVQVECNIPLQLDEIPADDLNLPSETYTTDFVIHFTDGKIAVREAVFRSHLSRPSVAERLELSRRYWQQQGINDWGIMQVETIAIKSGNIIVDAILTQKIDECLDNSIALAMKAEIPSHIMREEDTCEVFGSILDFAVATSNKQPKDKKIKIVLQDQGNQLKVFVSSNAAVFDSADSARMAEIEQSTAKILSAYNGIVSAQQDEDQSVITWSLLIPLPQDSEWLASYIYDSSEALSSGVRTVKQ